MESNSVVVEICFASMASVIPALCAAVAYRTPLGKVVEALRSFPWTLCALGLALPFMVRGLPPVLIWTISYIRWDFQRGALNHPGLFSDLFSIPPSFFLVVGLFGPFFEELGWRGILQPKWEGQFEVRRSILLVGLVWALWHFPTAGQTVPIEAMLTLFLRLGSTALLASVLAWFLLKGRSPWPVYLFHVAYNVSLLVFATENLPDAGQREVPLACAWRSSPWFCGGSFRFVRNCVRMHKR